MITSRFLKFYQCHLIDFHYAWWLGGTVFPIENNIIPTIKSALSVSDLDSIRALMTAGKKFGNFQIQVN